jgi:nucleolar protein 56
MTDVRVISLEAHVIETPVGLFVVDEEMRILEKIFFANNPQTAAAELKQIQEGMLSEAVSDALKRGGRKVDLLVFENEPLAKASREQLELKVTVKPTISDQFRERLASDWKGREKWIKQQELDIPILRTPEAYNEFARQVTLQLARTGIALAAARRDLSAVQAVRAMDDLDKTINLLAGRVREWFGLHFPEMDRIIEKHDTYARLVSKLGNRRNFTYDNLVSEGLPKETAKQLANSAAKSMGAQLEEVDLDVLRSFCDLMLDLYKFRGKSETYVDDVLKNVAPNMSAVAGASLSARLISIAGSLQNLAKMPASTLQVLGAEKALFRSLKTGARPPKHGVIFQHTAIHQSPRWQRGKIARALSGKLSIAARVDAFGGEFMGDKLRDDVNKKVDEIKERYKIAPPPKKREVGHKR